MGGKNKLQMRADLRLDLKDSGALWSDDELNRCVERAVADLSRFLPKEKVYEESLQFAVTSEAFTAPKDTDPDYIVDEQTLNGKSAGDTFTLTGSQPDTPRPIKIAVTVSAITNFTIVVRGADENGKAIEEAFHYGSGVTQTGKKNFKHVKEVELNQVSGTAVAGDKLDVGIGAYSDCWVYLANKPIKWGSETVTDAASNACKRDTDFYIDYFNGRIKAISGGEIAAEEVCSINYTKSQLGIDLSKLADLIRVERIEYPVGDVPQTFVTWDIWANLLYITGGYETQASMAEDKHIAVYYAAEHQAPTDYSPGSYPEFLDNTILLAAGAFALFIYSLSHEHQATLDMASVRLEFINTTAIHTLLATALTDIKKYLDNNSDADAAGILADITTEVANLRAAITTALTAANSYLDEVDTTDLQGAEGVWADYGDTYVTGASAPSIKKYLEDGDAFLNSVDVGGEGTDVARAHVEYARACVEIIRAHEQKRADFLQQATARTNAAMGYTQEAAQRLSTVRSYIEQAMGYRDVASVYARQAEAYITQITTYLSEARGYAESAGAEMVLADRFRDEAVERRNEAWNIWRDRKQYIGDYVGSPVRQHPQYRD